METIQSKTVKVQNVFGIVTPIEKAGTGQEQLERKVSVASDMGIANAKCVLVKEEEAKTDTSQIHVAPDDLVKDIVTKQEEVRKASDISLKMLMSTKRPEQELVNIPENTVEEVQSKVVKIEDQTDKVRLAVGDQTGKELKTAKVKVQTKPQKEPDQVEDISPKKLKPVKQREQPLSKLKEVPVETIQSKTVKVQNVFGIVTPIEKAGTGQEQLERKVSVASDMGIANATCVLVKEEEAKTDTSQIHVAPDDLVKDIVTKQEEVRKASDISLKMLMSTKRPEQELVNIPENTVEEVQSKVVKIEDQTDKVRLAVEDQTGKELKTAKVKVQTKPQKEPDQVEDISPKKLKPVKQREQPLSKLKEVPVETIQSKTVKVQNVFGIVTPIEKAGTGQEQLERKISVASDMGIANATCVLVKEEEAKTDTSQIHVAPDDLVKDIVRKQEEVRKASDISLKMLMSTKWPEQELVNIPENTVEEVQSKVVKIEDQTDKVRLAVEDQTGKELKTAKVKVQTKPLKEPDQVEDISPKKLNSVKQREQPLSKLKEVPMETIQSKTVKVQNVFGIVTPIEKAGTGQEQLERKVSVASDMGIANAKCVLVKEEEAKTDTSQIHVAPDDLVKDIVTKQEEVRLASDISLKMLMSTKRPEQELVNIPENTVEEVQSKVVKIEDQTDKVRLAVEDQTGKELKTAKVKVQTKPLKEPDHVEDISPKKLKSVEQREQPLSKLKEVPVETIQSKTVKVQNVFGIVTPIEKAETGQERLERRVSVASDMGIANVKCVLVKEEEAKTDTSQIHVAPDDLVKDIVTKQEEVQEASDLSLKMLMSTKKPEQELVNIPENTVEKVISKVITIEDQTDKVRLAVEDQTSKELKTANVKVQTKPLKEPDQVEGISPNKLKSVKQREQPLSKLKEVPVETIQSKTVKVQNVFGIITPIEKAEPGQEQLERKVSVASDMGNVKCVLVKEEEAKTDISQIHVAPDDLVKDIVTKQEQVWKASDISLKMLMSTKRPEQELVNIPENTVEEVQSKVVKIEDQTDKVRLAVEDQTGKELKTAKVKVQTKPQKEPDHVEDISPKKLKSVEQREQPLSKLKEVPVETIQSKTVKVQSVFGIVTPIEKAETGQEQLERRVSVASDMGIANVKCVFVKEEEAKTDTSQIHVAPDDLVKDIVTKQEEVQEASDLSLKMLMSTKKPEQELVNIPENTVEKVISKVITIEDQTDKVRLAVEDQTSKELKTANVKVQTKPLKEPDQVEGISPNKLKSVKQREQLLSKLKEVPVETIQSKTVKVQETKKRDQETEITKKITDNQNLIESVASVTDIDTEQKAVQKKLQYESKTKENYPESGMNITQRSTLGAELEEVYRDAPLQRSHFICKQEEKTTIFPLEQKEKKSLPVGASSKGIDGKHFLSPLVLPAHPSALPSLFQGLLTVFFSSSSISYHPFLAQSVFLHLIKSTH